MLLLRTLSTNIILEREFSSFWLEFTLCSVLFIFRVEITFNFLNTCELFEPNIGEMFTIYFILGVPGLLQCYCNWLFLVVSWANARCFLEHCCVSEFSPTWMQNSDPHNGRWLANSGGDFFSFWKSDQVVLRILQKLKQCCIPHYCLYCSVMFFYCCWTSF